MSDVDRKLKRLAELRECDDIIVYFTSDKRPLELFSTQIADDVIPLFDKHLHKIGKKNKIALFLYSTGGALEAPWPIVSLIREHCKEFEAIIPFKALSAATLICLGADKLLMTPLSFLSPVDPQGNFQVGQERKKIQVEDVAGFVDFAKNKVGVAEQSSLAEVLKILSSEIPPSVLGSVHRTHSLIRLLADKMLKTHKNKLEEHQEKVIIENLTEKLFCHQHLIGRGEAKYKIGFKRLIEYANDEEEILIREIFAYYQEQLRLTENFDPLDILGTDEQKILKLKRALIKSSVAEDAFMTEYQFQKGQQPLQKPLISINKEGWEEIPLGQPQKREVKNVKTANK